MKNSLGQSVILTLFGESHGRAVGAVIDGLAPGIKVDEDRIKYELSRRRPSGPFDTPRRESDRFEILSGVYNERTTGTPICIVVYNENTKSSDYVYGVARPSHADLTARYKYHGFEDFRGGGHFSGRVTAAVVAAGGILLPALENLGINIGTHILSCAGVYDKEFGDVEEDLKVLKKHSFPTLDELAAVRMADGIANVRKSGDSVGGKTQTAICGLPTGLGEPWFDSVEGLLSRAVFSLGGVKGIEFGLGFGFTDTIGSVCNDAFRFDNGRIFTETNNNAGINGGITNGMPVIFNCAVKPTPSISMEQKTVDFLKGENTVLSIKGRHDPAIVRRICPVIDSVSALVISDILALRYGTDVFTKGV